MQISSKWNSNDANRLAYVIRVLFPYLKHLHIIRIYWNYLMKKDIHPQYFSEAKATCACGNTFTVGSTKPELHVEICSACHPFYTGKEKLIDTAGRVDRFRKMQTKKTEISAKKGAKKERVKKQSSK